MDLLVYVWEFLNLDTQELVTYFTYTSDVQLASSQFVEDEETSNYSVDLVEVKTCTVGDEELDYVLDPEYHTVCAT